MWFRLWLRLRLRLWLRSGSAPALDTAPALDMAPALVVARVLASSHSLALERLRLVAPAWIRLRLRLRWVRLLPALEPPVFSFYRKQNTFSPIACSAKNPGSKKELRTRILLIRPLARSKRVSLIARTRINAFWRADPIVQPKLRNANQAWSSRCSALS